MKIKDPTGSIYAFVYAEVAEPLFEITGKEIMDSTIGVRNLLQYST